ncbi:MAG: hypothetical protein G3M78_00790 [Candidatus Nitrohelix vancouverensis]|uniref:Uncharacterized protein n=1 Tax=Candidatus Nitrohelix vancouverensis TaxID=2705534 RepID=A0A7T0BZY8_9BACT|nr:MAG: hypothetical protein G3M78_00790 [Candidatus Nitrohelix vancouverensis]
MKQNADGTQQLKEYSLNQEKLYRAEKIKQELDRENMKLMKQLFGGQVPEHYQGLKA